MSRSPLRPPFRARPRAAAAVVATALTALACTATAGAAAAPTGSVEAITRATGVTGAAPGNVLAVSGVISPDGRSSVFSADTTGFAGPTDANAPIYLFVRDIVANTTRQLTSSGRSFSTGIDKNGRYVSFETYDPTVRNADGSISQDTYRLYVADLTTGAVSLVSRASGASGAAASGARGMIDGNGTAVVFTANNVPGLGSGLFRRNLQTNVTTRLGNNPNAAWSTDPTFITSVSDDGTKIGFYDVYPHGLIVTPTGTITTGGATVVSADGTTAAWSEYDASGTSHVISRNLATGAQRQFPGTAQDVMWISPDGKQIATGYSMGLNDFRDHPAQFLSDPGASWIDAGPFAASLRAPYAFQYDSTHPAFLSRTGTYAQFHVQNAIVAANAYGGSLPGGADRPPANAYLYVNTAQCASENTQYMTANPQSTVFEAAKSVTGTVSFNGQVVGTDTATSDQQFGVPIPAGATKMHIDLKVTYPDGSTNSGSYDYPVRTLTDC